MSPKDGLPRVQVTPGSQSSVGHCAHPSGGSARAGMGMGRDGKVHSCPGKGAGVGAALGLGAGGLVHF